MAILRQYLEQLRASRPEQDMLALHRVGVPIPAKATQQRGSSTAQVTANHGPNEAQRLPVLLTAS